MNDSEQNIKSNSLNRPLAIFISISVVFVILLAFISIYFYVSITSSIEDKLKSPYVASESEICSYVAKECDNATLLDSVYKEEPTPQRICTFRDEDRGFTFTAYSKRGPQNQLTVIPLFTTDYECDYKARFYHWLEPQIKPILENEGIKLEQNKTVDFPYINERCYLFEEKVLVTNIEQEESDKKLITETLNSFDLPKFYKSFDIDVYYLENNTFNLSNEVNSNDDISSDNSSSNGAISRMVAEDDVDLKGLSDLTLEQFSLCAMYMPKDANIDGGRPLSSKVYEDIKDFLFYLRCQRGTSGTRLDPDTKEEISSYVNSSYEDWEYILREVYGEEHPEDVRVMLEDGFNGEKSVYYNSEEDKVYSEAGKVALFELYTLVTDVYKEENIYKITYDVYSVYSEEDVPIDTVYVTIEEDDGNEYGYRLIDIN